MAAATLWFVFDELDSDLIETSVKKRMSISVGYYWDAATMFGATLEA